MWLADEAKQPLTADAFLRQFQAGQFGQLATEEVPNLGDEDQPHWAGFRFQSQLATARTMVLELDFIGPDSIGFYLWENNKLVKAVPHSSWRTPVRERDTPHRVPAFRFSIRPGAAYVCGLRVQQKAGYLVLPIQLHEEHYFDRYKTVVNLTHGLTAGFLLLAGVIGLAFWLLTHQRLYGYYVVYVIGIAGFGLEEQGYLNQYLLGYSDLLASQGAWPVFSQLAVIGHTLFAIHFLRLNQLPFRGWVVAGHIVCTVSAALILLLCLGVVPFTDTLYQLTLAFSFSYISLSFVYLLLAARQQRRESYLYVLAVSPLFLSMLYAVLATIGLVPENWLLFGLLSYTPAWEVGVLCVGLAISFSLEQREKVLALQESTRLQEHTVRAIDNAQESERRRIAQDLHDDVGNTLAAAKGMLGTVSRKLLVQIDYPEVLRAQSLIEKAGQDLRTISHNLIPVEFEKYKLSDVIRQSVERANSAAETIQFEYVHAGVERQLTPERSLVVYRIINELINNILKHSGARSAIIQLVYQPESLVVSVEDDGKGFQVVNSGISAAGIGLKNVSSRSIYIGATLDISSDTSGTYVLVEVPYA